MPRLKVVAHYRSGELVKGFAELAVPVDQKGVPDSAPISLPRQIKVEPELGGRATTVPTDALKALFFVKTFAGDSGYSETKFFNPEPKIEGLWVHMAFSDGELCEGIIHNSLGFINESGFLMKPPDPMSNNNAVYIWKASLTEFRVVGVKAKY
jgi:hypothetical protein